jgi:hypothetical protein
VNEVPGAALAEGRRPRAELLGRLGFAQPKQRGCLAVLILYLFYRATSPQG